MSNFNYFLRDFWENGSSQRKIPYNFYIGGGTFEEKFLICVSAMKLYMFYIPLESLLNVHSEYYMVQGGPVTKLDTFFHLNSIFDRKNREKMRKNQLFMPSSAPKFLYFSLKIADGRFFRGNLASLFLQTHAKSLPLSLGVILRFL